MDERRKEKPLLHSLLSQGDRLELKMLGGEEPRLLPPAGASPPPRSSNQFGGGTGTSMSVLMSGCPAAKAPQICRAGSSSDPNSTATGTGSCCALSPWAASFKNPMLGAWIYGFSLVRLEVLHFSSSSPISAPNLPYFLYSSHFWSIFGHLDRFCKSPRESFSSLATEEGWKHRAAVPGIQ